MRVECEHCHALVEPSWAVDGAQIRARCPACGADSRATATPARNRPVRATDPAWAAPAPAAPSECPKCGMAPLTGVACARCGLAIDRMPAWYEEATPAPALAEAWDACLAAWDDAAAHERAASVALTVGEQPWLARRYRAILRERPGDSEATARLSRLGRIAQAAVLATAATPRVARFRRGSALAVLAALVLVVVGGLLLTLYLVRKNATDDDAAGVRVRATPADRPRPPR